MQLLCMSVVLYILNTLYGTVLGHGYLLDPPNRSSMWRAGFNVSTNYNDNELNCGGFKHQKNLGGKCGLCGDPYNQSAPRDNEAGGTYAKGIISKYYTTGSTVDITVTITMNHLGFFEFRLCENNDVTKTITKECLKHLLVNPRSGKTKHYIKERFGDIVTRVKLPENVTCTQCVLQWRYHTENSWGEDDRGSCLGCGPQEEFFGCSDIAISSSGVTNAAPTLETSTLSAILKSSSTGRGSTERTEATTGMTVKKEATTSPTPTKKKQTSLSTLTKTSSPVPTTTTTADTTTAPSTNGRSCVSIAVNAEDKWCDINCNHVPRFCPVNLCSCT